MPVDPRGASGARHAAGAPARCLRAGLLTVVVVLASIVSHVYASGEPPTAGAVTLVVGATALASLVLTRRRLSVPTLTALMVAVEVWTHAVCAASTPMSGMGHSVGAVMVSHHLIAAGIAVVYLRCGEQLIWDYLCMKTDQVTSTVSIPLPRPGLLYPRIHHDVVPCSSQVELRHWTIRGPPPPSSPSGLESRRARLRTQHAPA